MINFKINRKFKKENFEMVNKSERKSKKIKKKLGTKMK